MADLLISPQSYTTPGGVPRKLLAGVFLVVMLTAMGVFLATAQDEPLQTGDQKARAELKKPDAMNALVKGRESSVDEAVERARSDLEQADRANALRADTARRLAASSAQSAGEASAQGSELPPMPSSPGETRGRPMPGEADAAAAERERASRSAAATVFDESGTAVTNDVADLRSGHSVDRSGLYTHRLAPEHQVNHARSNRSVGLLSQAHVHRSADDDVPAGEKGMQESMVQMLHALQGVGRPPSVPADRASRQKAWAGEAAQSGAAEALRPTPAASDLQLYQGTVIPCVLTRRINSDLPGPVTARVSMNVYDSRTSRKLLLPMGALLVGSYNSDVQEGQERLQFAFTRLRMPDGSTYELPGATGSDAAGQAGVQGDVDRHFARRFGSALLLGLLADRVTRVSALPRGGMADAGGLSATGQVVVDTAREELERQRSVAPTITVPEGARLHVEVVRDMDFPSVYGASE